MKNPDGVLFSMPRETESTREKSFRTLKTNSDTMKASRKYRSTPRRCIFRYGQDLWFHRSRQHCTRTQVTKRIRNYSRILNLRTSKVYSELREWWIEGNSEIQNVFPADNASYFGKTSVAQRANNKVDESKSVRLLGLRIMREKTSRSRRCNKKGDPIDFEWKIFPGAKA